MTTFEQEWAGLKQGGDGEAGLRLAGAGEDGGGRDGVKSDAGAWASAGRSVGTLGRNARKALTELENGQPGGAGLDPLAAISGLSPAAAGAGVQSASAQREVFSTWKRYLGDVAARCEALQSQLSKPGTEFAGTDTELAFEFERSNDGYADTPAVSNKGKG